MILPSEATKAPWSAHHRRLHRHLLRRPELLPSGDSLLLAVSGGQDSMALTVLLADLRRLHGWQLLLWHGNHGWRSEAADQAGALAAWAEQRGLPLRVEQADPAPLGEAASRAWRYGCLERAALELGCRQVVTGHTASDRAETVLLNLARGSHLRGLTSLRAQRPLAQGPGQGPRLVRPLLPFSREDTARVCRDLAIPVWEDSSNADRRYRRNRLRAEVMPVLEALHPGASRRIAAQAERLEEELTDQDQLLDLALQGLALASDPSGLTLARRALGQLGPANRRRLLQHWLRRHGAQGLEGAALEDLGRRLEPEQGPGQQDLAGGWRLRWQRSTLGLQAPGDPEHGDG